MASHRFDSLNKAPLEKTTGEVPGIPLQVSDGQENVQKGNWLEAIVKKKRTQGYKQSSGCFKGMNAYKEKQLFLLPDYGLLVYFDEHKVKISNQAINQKISGFLFLHTLKTVESGYKGHLLKLILSKEGKMSVIEFQDEETRITWENSLQHYMAQEPSR